MSHSQASDVSRREFLAVAGTVGAATALVAPKTSSAAAFQADFVVTVDVTKTPFAYSCPQSSDPYNLYVDLTAAKTVSWKAVSQGSNHSVGIFFPKETPFLDPNGRPMYALLWSEREENANPIIAKLDPYASGKYEYRVAVFDKQTGTTYSEDPRIIVGSGGIELRAELEKIRGELKSLEQSSNSEEVKDKLKAIEDELSGIIASLR